MSKTALGHVRGIIFDLDGTLIHSTIDFVQMRRKTFELMRQAGIPERCLDSTKSIAHNLNASVRFLTEKGRPEEARSLYREAGEIMSEIEMLKVGETKAVTGSTEAIVLLLERGYSVAVLTRGSRRYTGAALAAAGLAEILPHRVCRDDHPDEEAKPNPIAMTRAAEKIGLAKEECLLIGDHAMDLECARSAGSVFVGVLTGATDEEAWNRHGEVITIKDVSCLPELLLIDKRSRWNR